MVKLTDLPEDVVLGVFLVRIWFTEKVYGDNPLVCPSGTGLPSNRKGFLLDAQGTDVSKASKWSTMRRSWRLGHASSSLLYETVDIFHSPLSSI